MNDPRPNDYLPGPWYRTRGPGAAPPRIERFTPYVLRPPEGYRIGTLYGAPVRFIEDVA